MVGSGRTPGRAASPRCGGLHQRPAVLVIFGDFSLIVPVAGTAMRFVNDVRDELWPGVTVLFTRYNANQPLGVPVREHDLVLGFEFSLQPAANEDRVT
jgi:hypothetical protein